MTPAAVTEEGWPLLLARLAGAEAVDASAVASGALKRRREVRDGAGLLRLGMGYGPGGLSLREASAWADTQGIARMSDVALLKRLRAAADWYGELAGQLLSAQAGVAPAQAGVRPLRLVDGTVLSAPGSAGSDWRLHVAYDPQAQRFTALELTDGLGAERLERLPVLPGEIRIADRGFGGRPDGFRALSEGPGDYVVRVSWRGLHWCTPDGGRFDILGFLRSLGPAAIGEARVAIGRARGKRGWQPVEARLIALAMPPEQAEQARKRARRAASKHSQQLQAGTVEAAGFLLLLTSLEAGDYTAAQVGALYRLRWQVELAFKRLKSLLHLDELRAKDPELARAWIYTHLIAALMLDEVAQHALDSSP